MLEYLEFVRDSVDDKRKEFTIDFINAHQDVDDIRKAFIKERTANMFDEKVPEHERSLDESILVLYNNLKLYPEEARRRLVDEYISRANVLVEEKKERILVNYRPYIWESVVNVFGIYNDEFVNDIVDLINVDRHLDDSLHVDVDRHLDDSHRALEEAFFKFPNRNIDLEPLSEHILFARMRAGYNIKLDPFLLLSTINNYRKDRWDTSVRYAHSNIHSIYNTDDGVINGDRVINVPVTDLLHRIYQSGYESHRHMYLKYIELLRDVCVHLGIKHDVNVNKDDPYASTITAEVHYNGPTVSSCQLYGHDRMPDMPNLRERMRREVDIYVRKHYADDMKLLLGGADDLDRSDISRPNVPDSNLYTQVDSNLAKYAVEYPNQIVPVLVIISILCFITLMLHAIYMCVRPRNILVCHVDADISNNK
jgi:hypothetical protein